MRNKYQKTNRNFFIFSVTVYKNGKQMLSKK